MAPSANGLQQFTTSAPLCSLSPDTALPITCCIGCVCGIDLRGQSRAGQLWHLNIKHGDSGAVILSKGRGLPALFVQSQHLPHCYTVRRSADITHVGTSNLHIFGSNTRHWTDYSTRHILPAAASSLAIKASNEALSLHQLLVIG